MSGDQRSALVFRSPITAYRNSRGSVILPAIALAATVIGRREEHLRFLVAHAAGEIAVRRADALDAAC